MKIATLIATCYLPTNLVLVRRTLCDPPGRLVNFLQQAFFSTGLVLYNDGKGGITVRTQVWIAVVMSAILIGATFGVASYWYRWRRGEHNNAGTSVPPPRIGHE
jgi:hypothetical protein